MPRKKQSPEYWKAYAERKRREGLCHRCTAKRAEGHTLCERHLREKRKP